MYATVTEWETEAPATPESFNDTPDIQLFHPDASLSWVK